MRVTVSVVSLVVAICLVACGDEAVEGDVASTTSPTAEDAADGAVTDTFTPFEETTVTQPDSSPTTTVTDTSTDTEVTAPLCDTNPKPFFCPCEDGIQCESTYCVEVDEDDVARRCSRTCIDACPEGWQCVGLGGGDPVFICKPPVDTLCQSCTNNSDCLGIDRMCVTFEDGKFCGDDCDIDNDQCPAGYACNNIDDENGQTIAYQCLPTSGSCQCPDGTDYANDPLNCGFCKNACSFPGGVAGCANETCRLDDCQPGRVNLDAEESNGCEYECTKTNDADWPDAVCNGSDCDQDCDGIDGEYSRAVFVMSSGSAGGSGAPFDPINTITAGINLAQQTGKDHVYVAAGTYNEQVTMVTGISVFGGYSNDLKWVRKLSQYTTTITSSSGTSSIRVVIADGIDGTRTALDGVVVNAGTNANPSGSSYAIWVRNSTAFFEIANVSAVGGSGGTGASGGPGVKGSDGEQGKDGTAGHEDQACNEPNQDCNIFGGDCEGPLRGAGGQGGTNSCASGLNSAGGKGGGGGCDDHGNNEKPDAGTPSPGGAAGGPAPSPQVIGNRGADGSGGNVGANGPAGQGSGSVSGSGFWTGADGSAGANATNGVGGGGGSGGGGGESWNDSWGGGGGGGGAGGCGGTAGEPGRSGGSSFGVFLFNSSPKLVGGAFGHKSGGNGGTGGLGGGGGTGRAGGSGGAGEDDSKAGGGGGKGGNGGRGGHGGGGAGGIAYGLYLSGNSDPSCSNLTFNPSGSGGTGGIGGVGGDNSGNKGADGLFGDKNKSSGSCP